VLLESREPLSHRGGRGDPYRGEGKALHHKEANKKNYNNDTYKIKDNNK
jgi:hypothetical protein